MESNICPRCKNKDTKITEYSAGEVVCNTCGYVFDIELIDEHNEQRLFSKNCSSNGFDNKELSRVSAGPSTYLFGDMDEIKILGNKRKLGFNIDDNNKKKFFQNSHSQKLLTEKEKKINRKNYDLIKICTKLREIGDNFNISKMIYESAKEEAIKLYEYGKIHVRNNSNYELILGLLINYSLKNNTNSCFSKEELINYFGCDLDVLKNEAFKIYQILDKSDEIKLKEKKTKKIDNSEKEKGLDDYLEKLKNYIADIITKSKIDPITGICDSYELIHLYINQKIIKIENHHPICLAGGSLIFCIKLYKIQFTIKTKSMIKSDQTYSMNTSEEEEKLIEYIAKKCSSGINPNMIKRIYKIMVKYSSILENVEKFKSYIKNLSS